MKSTAHPKRQANYNNNPNPSIDLHGLLYVLDEFGDLLDLFIIHLLDSSGSHFLTPQKAHYQKLIRQTRLLRRQVESLINEGGAP